MPVMEQTEPGVKTVGVIGCFVSMLFEAGFAVEEVLAELTGAGVEDAQSHVNRWLWSDET
jgi:hypothetical protein